MVSKESLLKIKRDVEECIGQEILLRANIGRNRCVKKKGIVDSAYSSLFVVKDQETASKMTYNYTDIVTNNLQVILPNGEVLSSYDSCPTPKYTRL